MSFHERPEFFHEERVYYPDFADGETEAFVISLKYKEGA